MCTCASEEARDSIIAIATLHEAHCMHGPNLELGAVCGRSLVTCPDIWVAKTTPSNRGRVVGQGLVRLPLFSNQATPSKGHNSGSRAFSSNVHVFALAF
ncbi:hypothetical protein VNO77_44336 [Canavalia gladiata]|uniref:Uncharacterized protein n=1 Tax=Canavalia gladiata TaxID=3824 RepID=A0AAN9JYT1_CANGL